jgi:cell division protein FtsZ
MGLLRRLTTGLSRREEDEAILADPVRPARPSESQRRAAPEQSPYAPRRQAADSAARPQSLGRPAGEEDQLEIPAFLRRQSN